MTLIDTTPTTPTVEVGTIFSSSWGYDQTNVSFYEVVKVTATGVRLRGIRKRIVSEDGYGSDGVVPIAGSFREDRPAFFRRLHVGRDYAGVNITSYEWASLWDGEPERQTSSGWGH